MAKKPGRQEKNTVDFFPHHVTEDKTVKILEFCFKQKGHPTQGYAGYYKLLELIGDTKHHRVEFNKSQDKYYALHRVGLEEGEFIEMIELLVAMDKVDRELWENEKVIWIDDFVSSLSAVYYKRGRPLPTKNGIVSVTSNSISVTSNCVSVTSNCVSDTRNTQYSRVEESKGEESVANDITHTQQLDLDKYSEQYPALDVELSFGKYKSHCEKKSQFISDTDFSLWVRSDMNSGWNQKAVSDVDKTNEFVTMYCVDGHGTKKADENKTWNSFCDECEKQMVSENEMRHIRGKQLEKQNKQS